MSGVCIRVLPRTDYDFHIESPPTPPPTHRRGARTLDRPREPARTPRQAARITRCAQRATERRTTRSRQEASR